jgi:hypothetical protein
MSKFHPNPKRLAAKRGPTEREKMAQATASFAISKLSEVF